MSWICQQSTNLQRTPGELTPRDQLHSLKSANLSNVGQVCEASVIEIYYELLMQPLVERSSKLLLPCATLKLRTLKSLKLLEDTRKCEDFQKPFMVEPV